MPSLVSVVKTSSPRSPSGSVPARHRIDYLRVEMVFPDVQAVLGLHALVRDTRPHHLRQAVDIDSMHVEGLLDLIAHAVAPRLGAEDADFQ